MTSTGPELKSGAAWLASATPEEVDEFLNGLSENALLSLPWLFEFWALPHQLPPRGAWKTWIIMGGRGAGKTRAGAEWVRSEVEGPGPLDAGRSKRVALIGETVDQVREVMVLGESGILACSPPDRRPEWVASRHQLVWPNGAIAQVFSAHEPESLRGPQFDAAWADEYGAPAIDKGTNQPNKFVDVKSSESGLPAWSNGRRDDLIHMQYILAIVSYWSDPEKNPISPIYDDRMIDISRAHVWAWDARPFPQFPGLATVWNDGDNYSRGHWLNGRATNQPLAAVVQEICGRSGVDEANTQGLYGIVRGFLQGDIATGRATLQPLMLAYGLDVAERDGLLRFTNRTALVAAEIFDDELAVAGEIEGRFENTRLPDVETAGQVRVGYVDAQSSYEVRAAEVRFPDEESRGVSQTDLPLALTRAEGSAIVERWLAEARVARDVARFALPRSRLKIGTGDVVRHKGYRYRVDRVEQAEAQILEAVRVEPGVYVPSDLTADTIVTRGTLAAVPVYPVFLDLPLLSREEVPHAPHIAIAAEPWPGAVGVWSAGQDNGYELNRLIAASATVGVTESPLLRAAPGVWDRGAPLRIRLSSGELSSADELAVLNGANGMAIGDGSNGNWEVFQFQDAQIVAPDTYDISLRLRGQQGSDGLVPAVWPIGSTVVALDLSLVQVDLPLAARGLARYYRIGAASRGVDDPNTVLKVEAFDGAGLRPYPVAHLRVTTDDLSNVVAVWKRRTRINGDSWQSFEVPLGEETEAYVVRIVQGAITRAEYSVTTSTFTYSAAMRAADQVSGSFDLQVAQVSAVFGPGFYRSVTVTP